MTPQLTLSLLLSADGKTATRSGESLLSCASPGYLQRLSARRAAADGLLIDASTSPFSIPENKPLIVVGNSPAWQPVLDARPSGEVVVINDEQTLTAEKFRVIAENLGVRSIHCEPTSRLCRDLLKEKVVDILNLTVLLSLSGGHAAETITGNGSACAFADSHHFSLTSHEQTDQEIHLCYTSPSGSSTTFSNT